MFIRPFSYFAIALLKKTSMKRGLFIVNFLLLSVLGIAQTMQTKYCSDRSCYDEVPQAKAKYSKTVTDDNGTVTTTTRNLKKSQIEHSETWRDKEPMGVWVNGLGTGTEELDYNFEILYKERCSNEGSLQNVKDFFTSDQSVGYTAPAIDFKKPDIISFIISTLRYPAEPRRRGIQGVVELTFTITKEGTIQDVVVTKGVHLLLDKEAARIVRKLKLSRPPMLNGKPQDVCATMPVKFRLA
jgi:TonB family protein